MSHPSASARQRVLLVEDDDALRIAVAHCLSSAGYTIEEVATGADAVEAARILPPDVMVVDSMLPDSGGLGVARAVRRLEGLHELPVLFTTALSNPALLRQLAPAPVLLKPFSRLELLEEVRRVTGSAHEAGSASSAQLTSR